MDSLTPYINQQISGLILQPFPIHFDCNDYHIIIFFEGHSEYESIEAMIQEREGTEPYIRAIITCLDKTQIDHINDRYIFEKLKSKKSNREIYFTPIQYSYTRKCFKNHIILKFTSYKGGEIILEACPASKPTVKYAKLIDPLGHSITSSLPVMYPAKATLIGTKSKININGIQYKIPVKIKVPFFFTGLNGFYSELFNIGILRAEERNLTLIKSPVNLKLGEKWVYKSVYETFIYEITHIGENLIIIKSKNEEVKFEIIKYGLAIKDLSVYSSCKNYKNAKFSIHFNPSIIIQPSEINVIQKSKSQFSISINEYNSLITGILEAETGKASVKLLLKPKQPSWAVERNISILINVSDNDFYINTEIIKE